MSTPIGAAVSSHFLVRGFSEFERVIKEQFPSVGVRVIQDHVSIPDRKIVELHAIDGYWPLEAEDPNLYGGDLIDVVQGFLPDDTKAYFHSISFQGPRDIRIQSQAIDNKSVRVTVELKDIERLLDLGFSMRR